FFLVLSQGGECSASVVAAGGRHHLIDHLLQLQGAGILIGRRVGRPVAVHIQLPADELGQILVGQAVELADDLGGLRRQSNHIVVRGKIHDHIVHVGGNGLLGLIHQGRVLLSGPVVAEVRGVGHRGPPILVLEVHIVLRAAEHVAEPHILAPAVAVAVGAVDLGPVVAALIKVVFAVDTVVQQVLSLVGGNKLHQIQHPLGVLAGVGNEIVGVDPGTGLVDGAVAAVAGKGIAHGQIVDGGVGVGSRPGRLVEVTELAGIAEAEVHRADAAGAEVGVGVVKVAADADAAAQSAVQIQLPELPHNGLAGLGGSGNRPVLRVGPQLAGEHNALHVRAHSGLLDAGALGHGKGVVNLVPGGQLVIAGPAAHVARAARGLAVGQELIHSLGHRAAVDLIQDRLVIHRNAGEGGIGKGGDGVDGIGGVGIAGVQLVVHLVLVRVDDLVQGGVAVRVGVDDLADVDHQLVLDVAGDLLRLAPGGEQVRRRAGVQLGLHAVVKALGAGVILQGNVASVLNGLTAGIIHIHLSIIQVV